MNLRNLPEDTTVDEKNGFTVYSEDDIHLQKVKAKKFREQTGVGIKYWKETENTFWRVQSNPEGYVYDDFFTVPGNTEIIVGYDTWAFYEGAPDEHKTTPVITPDGPVPGVEVNWLSGIPHHYYILKRTSNKSVMGGVLWWKFWNGQNSRYLNSTQHELELNLPGWLLMSTDKDDLEYQLIIRDAWTYDDFPRAIRDRIDLGAFLYEHEDDVVLETVLPLNTPYTHYATGLSFYVNGVPSAENFESIIRYVSPPSPGDVATYTKTLWDQFYAYKPPSDLDPILYPHKDDINLYRSIHTSGVYPCMDNEDPYGPGQTFTYQSGIAWMTSREHWCELGEIPAYVPNVTGRMYDHIKNVKFASYDWHADGKYNYATMWEDPDENYGCGTGGRYIGLQSSLYSPYLAYLGAVYEVSDFAYTGDNEGHGRDAITYLFHDAKIKSLEEYFTGIATGFGPRQKTFYSGDIDSEVDEPDVRYSNYNVDDKGNIIAHSLNVTDSVKSDGTPLTLTVDPEYSTGTKLFSFTVADGTIINVYAPNNQTPKELNTTVLFENTNTGSARKINSMTLSDLPENYDVLIFDIGGDVNSYTKRTRHYIYPACAQFNTDDWDSLSAYSDSANDANYVGIVRQIKPDTTTYRLRYSGNAWIRRVIGVKLSEVGGN